MYSAGYFNQSKLPMMPCFVSIASSKSVGVGVYDKPMNRGYQMQDRYVEGIYMHLFACMECLSHKIALLSPHSTILLKLK